MYNLLAKALSDVNFDPKTDRLFSVGDLVDRGPHSEKCLHLIKEPWFYAVRGNHEQMIIDAFDGNLDTSNHITNGGTWFYATTTDASRKECLDLALAMPLLIETQVDNYSIGFVHGDISDWDKTWESINTLSEKDVYKDNTANRLLWGRHRIYNSVRLTCKGIDHVFLGHTPLTEMKSLANCHFIDTAAVFGNKLTLLCISDFLRKRYE